MKSITEYTPEEKKEMSEKLQKLRAALKDTPVKELFEDYNRHINYAHYTFSGKISNKLIQLLGRMPTTDEIIMIADGGFHHFGATCSIFPDRSFSGKINID